MTAASRSKGIRDMSPARRARSVLLIDAFVNLVLGILLLVPDPRLSRFLGIPDPGTRFYSSIMGAVFVGITIALVYEALGRGKGNWVGLGLVGAVSINACGGVALSIWLLIGDLALPLRGYIVLWTLAAILVVASTLEVRAAISSRADGCATQGRRR
jgi:hypothetical protein